MTVRSFLEYNNGSEWIKNENVKIKGFIYDKEGTCYEGKNLSEYFTGIKNLQELEDVLKRANGVFSLIYELGDELILYSDKSRFHTLFYTWNNDQLLVSDSVEKLLSFLPSWNIDNESVEAFSGMGFVPGNKTLIQGIYQLQASEFLIIRDGKKAGSRVLFDYSVTEFKAWGYDDAYRITKEKLECGFERMYNSLKGRQIVVPLSGGYDSRFIATFLKCCGARDVICFTYGKPSHSEVEISRQMAEKLGYKWFFIDHTREKAVHYEGDKEVRRYINFASQYTSMFFLSEYFSVRYLKQNGILEEGSVFIPGHSGDLLGGSQYLKAYNDSLNFDNFYRNFFQKKYIYYRYDKIRQSQLISSFKETHNIQNEFYQGKDIRSVYEDIDIKEKIAKFIINSSKVFSFFGYSVRFPFWDDEIVDHFKYLPYKSRKEKYLYNNILVNEYFKQFDLIAKKELEPGNLTLRIQEMKEFIKRKLPSKMQFRYVLKNDWADYYSLTSKMRGELHQKFPMAEMHPTSVNSYIIQWYVTKVKEKVGSL